MTEQPAFSLLSLRNYWENYQQRLIATVAPLSSEQLALPVASHQAIGDLVAHLIGARFWWFHRWMGEPEPPNLVNWGTDEDLRNATSVVSAFGMTWHMISPTLSRWTAADLEQMVSPAASVAEKASAHTREWIIWHVLEHEIHHGGELSLALGGHGLPGACRRCSASSIPTSIFCGGGNSDQMGSCRACSLAR